MKKLNSTDPMFKKIKALYKDDFFDESMEIEVISNELYQGAVNPKKLSPQWNKFFTFFMEDQNCARAIALYNIYKVMHHHYGRCDFKFEGNREYKNWIVEHKGVYFIISTKSEFIQPTDPAIKKALGNIIMSLYHELFKLGLQLMSEKPESFFKGVLTDVSQWGKKGIVMNNCFYSLAPKESIIKK